MRDARSRGRGIFRPLTHRRLMRFLTFLALAAGVLALAGCMTEDPDATYTNEDIQYREIHIDMLTHYWVSTQAGADSVRGDSAFFHGGWGVAVLLDKSRDGSAGVTYRLDSTRESGRTVFYPVAGDPDEFTCLIHERRALVWNSLPSSADVIREIQFVDSVDISYNYSLHPDSVEIWTPTYCEYFPGKGFRLPDTRLALGEYVIRY
jgi:hypothetical protein